MTHFLLEHEREGKWRMIVEDEADEVDDEVEEAQEAEGEHGGEGLV